MEMECSNDWDLQAVVRSCSFSSAAPQVPPPRGEEAQGLAGSVRAAAAAALLYDLEYLDLEGDLLRKPFLKPLGHELMISFPAASTSGLQPRQNPGRKPAASRSARPKRSKKSQLKKVVCEVPVADGGASTDLWAWRKYGQKPIKGSPYPRGYYKCSSLKGCMARKMVERSPAKPGVVVVTYIAEHCHPVPTQLNALAGTTRHKAAPPAADGRPPSSHSPDKAAADNADEAARCEDSAETSSTAAAADGGTETADEEHDFWPVGMELEEFLGPMDDEYDYDHFFDEDGVLGRRLSL